MTFSVDEVLGATLSDTLVKLEIPDAAGELDEASLSRGVLLGIWAVAAERLDTAGEEALLGVRRALESRVGPLRFELHDLRVRIESLSRVVVARASQNHATRASTVPQLYRDIEIYERRVAALRLALEEQR